MADNTFHCSIVTPEREVLDCEARSVVLPAWDGEIGILRNRAPLLFRVGIGRFRAETADGTRELFVDGGFAQMVDNRLSVLTEQARDLSELDREAARAELEEARDMKVTADPRSYVARQNALERARVTLRLTTGVDD